jgi:hypothetical protein
MLVFESLHGHPFVVLFVGTHAQDQKAIVINDVEDTLIFSPAVAAHRGSKPSKTSDDPDRQAWRMLIVLPQRLLQIWLARHTIYPSGQPYYQGGSKCMLFKRSVMEALHSELGRGGINA